MAKAHHNQISENQGQEKKILKAFKGNDTLDTEEQRNKGK